MKHRKKIFHRVMIWIFIILFILGILYIAYYLYNNHKNKKDVSNILNNVEVDNTEITSDKTKRMLQLEELQKENSDIVAWLEIEDTNINYPVLQTADNDFYMNHNYKKEWYVGGSLFLDKDFDLLNGSDNYLIYGHRMNDGTMFEDLLKYTNLKFYNAHKTIKFTTNDEDALYEILAVFYSRVYYQSEKNVFRYYYFVDAKNESEYNEFVSNAKKTSIYDTGVMAEYGEQLLTLSTCEYSQENGRFVVVAKKIQSGETNK